MGFVLEQFGGTSVVVRAVPALLVDVAYETALTDVLDLMEEGGGFETWEERPPTRLPVTGQSAPAR